MGRFDSLTALNQPSAPPVQETPEPTPAPVRKQAAPRVERGDPSPSPSPTGYPAPLTNRKMKDRHAFDIYEEQYETLKAIADEEKDQGLPGSMNRMIREAIDMYLTARKSGKK